MLVLADSVMFPALYLGEGLTRGLMMQFAKENAVFSVNLSSFLAIVLNNVARTLAPWFSRLNLSVGDPSYGQNLFALCQLTCCGLFLLVFEAGVRSVTPEPRPVMVIGLPSLNEAETLGSIGHLTSFEDLDGLRDFFLSMAGPVPSFFFPKLFQ